MRSLRDFSRSLFPTPPISCKTTDLAAALTLIVDQIPDPTLAAIAADLEETLKKPHVGAEGMSARQVLCMALIKQKEGLSYRDLHRLVEDSVCLRKFAGYEFTMVPQKSALQNNISAVRDETWELINHTIVRFGMKQGIDSPEKIRIDTTNTQTDIHHPTDASLLFDGVRVIARSCQKIRQRWSQLVFTFHNRTRASKKLAFLLSNTKCPKKQKKFYAKLVALAEETLEYGMQAWKALQACMFKEATEQGLARRYAEEIKGVCELLRRVIDQTKRRVFNGESVPAEEKVVSIFEPHTDILEKGKRETEFGHKVCLTMGAKLIFDAIVLEGNPVDTDSYIPAVQRMKQNYGKKAACIVATDQGFGSAKNAIEAAELGVTMQSFTGRKIAEEGRAFVVEDGPVRWKLDKFRAGAEGMISTIKRVGAGLTRCLWEGSERFVAYVWSVVTAFNVKAIADVLMERMAQARKKYPARC